MVSVWEESKVFNAMEEVVLKYAGSITLVSENNISNVIYSSLKTHFNQDEIAILTLAIVQINAWNRFMKAFKIEAGKYEIGMYA